MTMSHHFNSCVFFFLFIFIFEPKSYSNNQILLPSDIDYVINNPKFEYSNNKEIWLVFKESFYEFNNLSEEFSLISVSKNFKGFSYVFIKDKNITYRNYYQWHEYPNHEVLADSLLNNKTNPLFEDLLSLEVFSKENFIKNKELIDLLFMLFVNTEVVSHDGLYTLHFNWLFSNKKRVKVIYGNNSLTNFLLILASKKLWQPYFSDKYHEKFMLTKHPYKFLYNQSSKYENIHEMNLDFLSSQINNMKKDIARGNMFYLYTIPDLKVYRISFFINDNKVKLFYKYINPQFIWTESNYFRTLKSQNIEVFIM
jgi:hypothetical protein